MVWDSESHRAREGLAQVIQYAGFFGFVCSMALCAATLVLCRAYEGIYGPHPFLTGLASGLSDLALGLALALTLVLGLGFALRLGIVSTRSDLLPSRMPLFL